LNLFQKTKQHRDAFIILFAATLMMTACQSNTVLQTASDSGFGGTGHSSQGFGDTGIIGTITKFGSIWVNGIEISYGDLTEITSDLTPNDHLKIGQQVILETLSGEHKTLTQKIHIYYPLAGKITQITENELVINHLNHIQMTNKTLFDDALSLKKGSYVSVNGYQTNHNNWTATRISQNPENKNFSHPYPTVAFSKAIKKVVIETNSKQLSKWKSLLKNNETADHLTTKTDQRIVLQGKYEKGRVTFVKITPYSDFIINQAEKNALIKPKETPEELNNLKQDQNEMIKLQQEQYEMIQLQQEQNEMMQLQRDQKDTLQDQVQQVQQLQELKDQFDQLQGINNQMGRPTY